MSQIFHPVTNTIARVTILGAFFILAALLWVGVMFQRSSYVTGVGVALGQPVPFSHKHHVKGLGIDCRYCHTSVEEGPFAGMPSTETCMSCHSILWKDSPMLEPVRRSFRTEVSLKWLRVHDSPDFVYFDHSIHVKKGVPCAACHGRVDEMPLMRREETLQMRWCLDCHRHPERFVGPREKVFDMDWKPGVKPWAEGKHFVKLYNVQSRTDCSVCHR